MWIKFDEVQVLLCISKRGLYKRIKKEIYNSKKGAKQQNGRHEMLIELESLPAAAQMIYHRGEHNKGNRTDIRFNTDDLRELSETELETAWSRMQIIIEMEQSRPGIKKCDHLNALCAREGISLSKLYGWKKKYESQGLAALVTRKSRTDVGHKRTFDPDAVKFLKAQYMERRNKLKAYEDIVAVAGDTGWEIGSYSQACRILQSEVDKNEAVRVYMNGGQLALKNIAAPCILRDYSDLMPLEYVCGDHMQCDVLVWDEAQKKIIRPWLTAWQDMRTRALWGWHICRQPNSRTIALALRHGILPKNDNNPVYGLPANAYIDNGKDYKSYYIAGKVWHMKRLGAIDFDIETKSVFAQLNIEPRFALPFNPGSKPIERFFETLHENFEAFLPGYVSGKTDTRDGAQVQQDIDQKRLVTLEQYKLELRKWVEDKYHQRGHRGKGMDDRSPIEEWTNELDNGFEPYTLRQGTTDLILLMRKEGVKVIRHGVTLNGEIFTHPALIHYFQSKVDLRYDPDNMSEVYVFQDGRYLLTARAFEYGSMRDDSETISRRMRQNRGAAKEVRRQFMALSNGHDRPNNLKNKSSVKIRKTVYDRDAEKLEEDALPKLPRIKNWKILPDGDN